MVSDPGLFHNLSVSVQCLFPWLQGPPTVSAYTCLDGTSQSHYSGLCQTNCHPWNTILATVVIGAPLNHGFSMDHWAEQQQGDCRDKRPGSSGNSSWDIHKEMLVFMGSVMWEVLSVYWGVTWQWPWWLCWCDCDLVPSRDLTLPSSHCHSSSSQQAAGHFIPGLPVALLESLLLMSVAIVLLLVLMTEAYLCQWCLSPWGHVVFCWPNF